jgi:hypothetical protein
MLVWLETALVGLVVGGAFIWAGRAIWRSRNKKKTGCSGCSAEGDCPLTDLETPLTTLEPISSPGRGEAKNPLQKP